jgi:hypothetical protein
MMWLGAMLSLGGIVWMGSRSLRHARPGMLRDTSLTGASETQAGHRWLAANWPGLAVTLLGIGVLLASQML